MERYESARDGEIDVAKEAEDRRLEGEASDRLVQALEAPPPEDIARERLAEADEGRKEREIGSPVNDDIGHAGRELARSEDEAALMEPYYKDLDNSVLNTLDKNFHPEISADRLAEAREHSTHFEPEPEYQRGLEAEYPGVSREERARIVGDLRRRTDPYVNSEGPELPTTVAHERLHQLSDPEFRDRFGSALDEGVTERLSREAMPGLHIKDLPEAYPEEEKLAGMIEARVGPDLERAYLSGNLEPLRTELDGQLGDGASDTLIDLVRDGKLDEAEDLIKGK